MKIGNFLFPESRDPQGDGAVIDDTMREALLSEKLGVDTLWLAEHHFDGNCAYVDPDGKLDVKNVANQIDWLQGQGFVDKGFDADAIIARDYVKPD